jgi:Family of unknown function (DUF5691)
MPQAEATALEAARRRWLAGGEAPVAGALAQGQTGAEAQLRMLAEAAQLRQIALAPEPPSARQPADPLPACALPLLDETLRPLFRRLIKLSSDRAHAALLTGFMATRGVMAHPFDWLPPKDAEGFPPVYFPLAAWVAGQGAQVLPATISPETWDDYTPAARRLAFALFRKSDAGGARALLEAKVQAVAADERLGLVACLATGLDPADRTFLESLLGDRSGKVKDLARSLLARLGFSDTDEDARELAAFFETSKSFLRRKVTVSLKAKLNDVQRRRVAELFDLVPIGALAAALGQSESELAATLDLSDQGFTRLILPAIAASAGDTGFRAFLARAKEAGHLGLETLLILSPRMTAESLAAEVQSLIERGAVSAIEPLAALLGPSLPPSVSRALAGSGYMKTLIQDAKAALGADGKDHAKQAALTRLKDALRLMGCLMQRADALALHGRIAGPIFHPADPALDPLNFNIALEGQPS